MTASTSPTHAPDSFPVQMYNLLNGHFLVQALYAAAMLRIADLLADGPKSAEELAQASSSHGPSLHRLLRMLASVGVFAKDEAGRFMLTPLAGTLRSDTPDSVRDWALFVAAPSIWTAWGTLLHSVRTGESAFEHAFGMPLFKYMADYSELAQSYNQWMVKQSQLQNPALLAGYDFSVHRKIVDVGGGQGATLVSILQSHPQLTGVLFDLPQVVTKAVIPETLSERCEIVSGDMLQSVPVGGDAYVLKRVLMDWGDELATKVLINCCNAMQSHGKILVIELVVPEGNEPSVSKFLDLAMLTLQHGGRLRTAAEHRRLFEAAGLQLTRVATTSSPIFVLEGIRRL